MMLMADMPRAKVAAALRCDEKSLSGILSYWVGRAVAARSLEGITAVAVDETSFKRGHSYVTLAIDAVGRRVIDVEEGRDKAAVERFAGKLAGKGGDQLKVEAVTSDMSKSYGPAIAEQFPNAEHVIDKFHVKQLVTSAMDEVRKAEQRAVADKKELFRSRWLFWVPRRKLTAEQSADLAALSRRFPWTGRACRIVAGLDDSYDSRGVEEAEGGVQGVVFMDAALPPGADEGGCARPHAAQGEDIGVLQEPLDQCRVRGHQLAGAGGEAQGPGLPDVRRVRGDDIPRRGKT